MPPASRAARARAAATPSAAVTAVAAYITLLTACAPPGSDSRRPNVILVSIDTLRADHLSCYGYGRPTTPFLDSLAREGVVFENLHSVTSWTAPAVVSMLSSVYPAGHGVVHGFADAGRIFRQEVVGDEHRLWAEEMKRHGYATFGVTANGHLAAELGFAQGFDRYECLGFADAPAVQAALRGWRDELAASEPYFLWVHYFDPHVPYRAREPWIEDFFGDWRDMDPGLTRLTPAMRFEEVGVRRGSRRMEFLKACYDSEIRAVDAAVEELFDWIEVGEEDLVVVTADHGDEFLDHGRFGHGKNLYGETVRVPAILRFPMGAHGGLRLDAPVSLVDLMPTALDFLGLPLPDAWHGESLLAHLEDGARHDAPPPRDLLCEISNGAHFQAILRWPWKFVADLEEPAQSQLFDLSRDPAETVDLVAEHPAVARALAADLVTLRARYVGAPAQSIEVELDEAQRRELEALGYVR